MGTQLKFTANEFGFGGSIVRRLGSTAKTGQAGPIGVDKLRRVHLRKRTIITSFVVSSAALINIVVSLLCAIWAIKIWVHG